MADPVEAGEAEFWRRFEARFEERACRLYQQAADQVRWNGWITRTTLAGMHALAVEAAEAGAMTTAAELRQTGAAAEMRFPFKATTYLSVRSRPGFVEIQ